MPQISVIVPVYKTRKYLKKCVESLLLQTFSDFEIILIDDGSPDDSGELCDQLAKTDERIRVMHKKNGGLSSARRAGYLVAKGEYIAFVDSDDYVSPEYLEKLISAAVKYEAELAICSYMLVTAERETAMHLPWSVAVLNKENVYTQYALPLVGRIYDGKHINLNGFMCLRLFKKSSIKQEYFVSEREYFTEDDMFDLLHSDQINHIAIIDEPLYYYVQHPESLSNCYRPDKWKMLQNRYRFCESWLKEHKLYEVGTERLAAAAIGAISVTIDNIVGQADYQLFKSVVQDIKASELYDDMMKTVHVQSLSSGQKIIYYLLKYNCFRILFVYRRRRMNK